MTWATIQITIVLILTAAVFIAFVRELLSPDVVAMLAFGVLLAVGILSPKEALGVFSNAGPIAVGAMFVLSAALERTGVIDRVGRVTNRTANTNPTVALVGLLLVVMFLSAFMNNTPIVVVLTPVAIGLARVLKLAPSRLLIPISYAAILGGTTTLIGTSTNLLVADLASQRGLAPISMFEITIPGTIIGLVGIAYLAVFGKWLLPDRASKTIEKLDRRFVTEILIPARSPFVGKTLTEARLTHESGVTVITVIRKGQSYRFGLEPMRLEAGDRLVIRTTVSDVMGLREAGTLIFGDPEEHHVEAIETRPTTVMEGVVGPRSRLIGYRNRRPQFPPRLRRAYPRHLPTGRRTAPELRGDCPSSGRYPTAGRPARRTAPPIRAQGAGEPDRADGAAVPPHQGADRHRRHSGGDGAGDRRPAAD